MPLDVAQVCAQLIRFDTTNRGGGDSAGERGAAEHVAALLQDNGVQPTLLEPAPRRTNVLARIPGTDPSLPAVLVQSHLDVVPADRAEWSFDPFAGEIRDGFVHGRGAVDMKDMAAMTLAVIDRWHTEGRRPRRDVVLAFVADEEDQGVYGAHWLVEHHAAHFSGVEAAISESGAFSYDVDGVRLYPVGTAERGTSHMKLTATGRAGHGSRRNEQNAVTALVTTLARIAAHQHPVRLTPTVEAFLVGAGKALGVEVDLDDVDGTLTRLGPAAKLAENTVRCSTTPTMLQAGYKVNVIPGTASAQVDVRTLPGTVDELVATIDSLLSPGVTCEFLEHQPPVEAPVDTPWFVAMADALRAEDPAAAVVPYCLGGGTDAKAFSRLGIHCYGFSPLQLPVGFDYRAMAHGVDERVPVAGLEFGVRVLDRFLSS